MTTDLTFEAFAAACKKVVVMAFTLEVTTSYFGENEKSVARWINPRTPATDQLGCRTTGAQNVPFNIVSQASALV